jgi:hypothetical protein
VHYSEVEHIKNFKLINRSIPNVSFKNVGYSQVSQFSVISNSIKQALIDFEVAL